LTKIFEIKIFFEKAVWIFPDSLFFYNKKNPAILSGVFCLQTLILFSVLIHF